MQRERGTGDGERGDRSIADLDLVLDLDFSDSDELLRAGSPSDRNPLLATHDHNRRPVAPTNCAAIIDARAVPALMEQSATQKADHRLLSALNMSSTMCRFLERSRSNPISVMVPWLGPSAANPPSPAPRSPFPVPCSPSPVPRPLFPVPRSPSPVPRPPLPVPRSPSPVPRPPSPFPVPRPPFPVPRHTPHELHRGKGVR